MSGRGTHVAAVLSLVAAALYTTVRIAELSQGRFFGIDEYQYGHATWLVAQGALPYVDFFEHHFPLSYVMHAPLFLPEWDFVTAALLLRKIVLVTLLAAAVLTGLGGWLATRSTPVALLSIILPASFGFALMSAVEYRSENFGAFYLLASLLLLEWNRSRNGKGLAVLCGVLAALAAAMTQKTTFVAGVTLGTMWAVDQVMQRRRARERQGSPYIAHPTLFFASAIGTGLALIGIAGVLGMLPAGFEATITQAALHESHYERFSIFERGYVAAFWETSRLSTVPLLLCAAAYLATPSGRFWLFPLGAWLLGGSTMVAPYPYNFVMLCWVGMLAAARGYGLIVEWVRSREGGLFAAAPLLYLLALPVLWNQLGYTAQPISNAHQLATLAKIEQFGAPGDAVIDNAGGAMFSPDGSYYFHHGAAHRVMFRDYFATELIRDYRDSRALFWLKDLRTKRLPEATQSYLEDHYIRGDGDLHVLGFETTSTSAEPRTTKIDVIRAGDYYIHRANRPPPERPKRPTDLHLDGEPLRTNRVFLEEREHTLLALPHSPRYLITPVPSSFFATGSRPRKTGNSGNEKRPRYTIMFQHKGSPGDSEANPD